MKGRFLVPVLLVSALSPLADSRSQAAPLLSYLDAPAGREVALPSGKWIARGFYTGPLFAGYFRLDSVSVSVSEVFDSPAGLQIAIYDRSGVFPGDERIWVSSLAPAVSGQFAAPADGLHLQPDSLYFLTLHAIPSSEPGGYSLDGYASEWAFEAQNGWQPFFWGSSDDGLNWNRRTALAKFAINATAVPESSSFALLSLGGLLLLVARRHNSGSQ